MKTTEFIKKLTDSQLEIAFIILGVYFNKNDYLNKPSESFINLSFEGNKALKDSGIALSNNYTVNQLKDLIKIEMFKRGIK